MNTYNAYYKGKVIEVQAESSYAAQKAAAVQFKAKKSYQVNVVVTKVNNREITHNPAIL